MMPPPSPHAALAFFLLWLLGVPSLSATPLGEPPPNDACAAALPIGEGTFAFNTIHATNEGPSAPPTCGDVGADVWFRYISPAPGFVTVRTCNLAPFDTILAAYSGGCDSPTLLACNDNLCAEQSAIFFDAAPGQVYLIRVAGAGSEQGDGAIAVSRGPPCVQQCPPASTPEGEPCGEDTNGGCSTNDRFLTLECNAIVCGSLFAAGGTRDLDWYSFTIEEPATVTLALVAELPVVMRLFSFEGECPPQAQIAAADAIPCGEPAIISQALPPGSYVFVVTVGSLSQPIFGGFPCGGRNAYTLGANLSRPCPTQEDFFEGFAHTSLGVAQLSAGSVIISNLGASGANGAAVVVGPTAEGWRTKGEIPAGTLPIGASIVAAATGTVGAFPDSTIGVARIDATAGNQLRFTPDFSPISATTYSLQLLNAGTSVFYEKGRTGGAFERANDGEVDQLTFGCVPEPCPNPPCPLTGPFTPIFELAFVAPTTFQIIGGPLVVADRILIVPENPDAPVTAISHVSITAAGVQSVTLDDEALVFRRFFHRAQGDARFDADDNQLGLTNMGSSGNDGVRIELDNRTRHYTAELQPLGDPGDPTNPIPDGASITYTLRGIIDGVPNSLYSSTRYEDAGDDLDVSFDFSNTGATSLLVLYLVGGVPVASESLEGNTAEFSTDDWVLTLENTYDSCGRIICQRPCWIPATTINSPSGLSVDAEVLDVVVTDPAVKLGGYTSAEVLFSDIAAISITDERVEFTETCCECDFNFDGGLNSQDFFDYLSCFFEDSCPLGRTADFNFDDIVNSQDFFDYLTCFFAGCD